MDPFLGEIRIFAGNFAPVGWNFCDGSQLSIAQYDALYSLLGTTYGGDGQTTFGVPDLRGRVPVHTNGNYPLGQLGGLESVPLTAANIPPHNHQFFASTNTADQASPANNVVGATTSGQIFRNAGGVADFATNAISVAGQGQPHDNLQPYLCVNYIIALEGIYPPQP
jgi:microcystin-dependent protein